MDWNEFRSVQRSAAYRRSAPGPIIDEGIYFDSATQVTQIGKSELPTLAWNSATPARHVSVIHSDSADHVL
ncbi:hypothetical protein A7G45_17930 [Mycolicibacterium llatzerense]|nr:hypothetical protein [Mycolicibacterium llatzerense]